MSTRDASRNVFFLVFLFWLQSACASLNFALLSDAGISNKHTKSTQKSLLRNNSKHLIMAGDNLYEGTYGDIWDPWKEKGFKFEVVSIGNHNDGYEQEVGYFEMPAEYYSKVYGKTVRFIVLNSDNRDNISEQMEFLDKTLEEAKEPFVFLVYHHPSFTLSQKHDWSERKEFQLEIRQRIFKYRNKLTALIVGHDHLALIAHFNDLPVLMSGAGSKQRKDFPVKNKQSGVQVNTDWFFNGDAYWADLQIHKHSNFAIVKFIRSDDDHVGCELTIRTGQEASFAKSCAN